MDFIEIDFKSVKDANKIVDAILENHRILLLKKKEIKEIKELKRQDFPKKEQKGDFTSKEESISNNINPNRETSYINQDFEEEISYYLSMINALKKEDLSSKLEECLPFKSQANYQKLIFRIKAELLKNISEIQHVMESEKSILDADDLAEFKEEILLNQSKIEMIAEIEIRQEKEEKTTDENHLFFVPTNSGNIKLLDEIDKVDSKYLEEFESLFSRIKSGNFKTVKRFNNNILNSIYYIKGSKTRVLFDRVGESDYVVVAAFIQKSDKAKAEGSSLDEKFKNYAEKKEAIKRNLEHFEFRKLNLGYEQELFRILNKNKDQQSYVKGIQQ